MSLEVAIRIASSLPIVKGRQRLAAVISDKRGRILSYGVNSYQKSHPTQKFYAEKANKPESCFLHAEISALISLTYANKMKVYRLSIARVLKNGEIGLARPCQSCQLAIKDYGIKCIEYTLGNT